MNDLVMEQSGSIEERFRCITLYSFNKWCKSTLFGSNVAKVVLIIAIRSA